MTSKTLTVLLFLAASITVHAQDTVLTSPQWKEYFAKTTKENYIGLQAADFDAKFKYGSYYNGLVIYKDSTRQSTEVNIQYLSISDLCDPKQSLNISTTQRNGTKSEYKISKKDLKAFVFSDLTFIFQVTRKHYKWVNATPNFWSIIVVDGPVLITQHYYPYKSSNGTSIISSGQIQKYEESIGSDVKTMGGFSFKKRMSETFSDHPELSQKILNGEEGYKQKNALKIILEYNDWVKREKPDMYNNSLYISGL